MAIDFDRDSLYAEVSATPISSLAKKYGLSDVGLRKICVALDIPLPGRGHWAKVAVGKPSPVPPLHATEGRTHYRFYPIEPPSTDTQAPVEWLEARLLFETDPANLITVNAALESPITAVREAKKVADKYVAQLEQARQEAMERSKPNVNWDMPRLRRGPSWRAYTEKGYLELPDTILPLRVSMGCLARSLRIWDAFLKAAKARGFSYSIESRRVLLSAFGQKAELRMSERIERVVGSMKSLSTVDVMMKARIKNVPTGNLRIFVGEKRFSDAPGNSLDDQLNSVFIEIFKVLCRAVLRKKQWDTERERRDAEDVLRAVLTVEAEKVSKREAEERQREVMLEAEAAAWHRANAIRAYVSAILQAAPAPLSESVDAWTAWATSVAERIDPLPMRADLMTFTPAHNEEH